MSPARRGASRPLPPRRAPEPVNFEMEVHTITGQQGWSPGSVAAVLFAAIKALPIAMQRRALESVRRQAREENAGEG